MKNIFVAAVVFCAMTGVQAEDLVIESLDGNGQLIFNELTNASSYQVEWASSPSGPWTNSWDALQFIPASGSGTVTSSVPMFYRVVMDLTPGNMVQIPGGTNSGTDPDYGAYSLTVETFHIDKTEVTKAEWDTVYTWATNHNYTFSNTAIGKAPEHPVTQINWYDCVKWCNARSEMERRTPCYTVGGQTFKTGQSTPECTFSANGFRLPTNIEWDYAARGGLSGKRFPHGDTISHDQANYFSNPLQGYDISATRNWHPAYDFGVDPFSSPVGSFAANGYNLHDMAGNVWELTTGSTGSESFIRGGSCLIDSSVSRCGFTGVHNPGISYFDAGFRTVCR